VDRSGCDFHRLSLGHRTGKSNEAVTDKVIPLNITYPLLSLCAKSCRCNGENDATTSEKFPAREVSRHGDGRFHKSVPPLSSLSLSILHFLVIFECLCFSLPLSLAPVFYLPLSLSLSLARFLFLSFDKLQIEQICATVYINNKNCAKCCQ